MPVRLIGEKIEKNENINLSPLLSPRRSPILLKKPIINNTIIINDKYDMNDKNDIEIHNNNNNNNNILIIK